MHIIPSYSLPTRISHFGTLQGEGTQQSHLERKKVQDILSKIIPLTHGPPSLKDRINEIKMALTERDHSEEAKQELIEVVNQIAIHRWNDSHSSIKEILSHLGMDDVQSSLFQIIPSVGIIHIKEQILYVDSKAFSSEAAAFPAIAQICLILDDYPAVNKICIQGTSLALSRDMFDKLLNKSENLNSLNWALCLNSASPIEAMKFLHWAIEGKKISLKDPLFVTDLLSQLNHVYGRVFQEESGEIHTDDALCKFSDLVQSIIIGHWDTTEKSLDQIIGNLKLNSFLYSKVKQPGQRAHLYRNAFCIDTEAFLSNNLEKLRQQVANLGSNINSFRIQGGTEYLSKQSLQTLIEALEKANPEERQTFLNIYRHPPTCLVEDKTKKIPPSLVLKSEMLKRMFLGGMKESQENHFLLTEISENVLEFLCSHADNLDGIICAPNTILELANAANFLGIPTLKQKCQEWLCRHANEQFRDLNKTDSYSECVNFFSQCQQWDFPELQALCEQKLIQGLFVSPRDKTLLSVMRERLEQLKTAGIYFKNLNFAITPSNNQAYVVPEIMELILILSYQNQIQSLSLMPGIEDLPTVLKILLKNVPNLKRLELQNCWNKNESEMIQPLISRFTQLESLSFQGELSDAMILGILMNGGSARWPHLKALKLQGNSLTSKIADALKLMPQLESLDLSGSNLIQNDIGSCLSNLPNLKELNLSGLKVGDESLDSCLIKLNNLKHLNLSQTSITDGLFPVIATLTHLEALDLSHCQNIKTKGTSVDWDKLKTLSTLEILKLDDLSLGDKALDFISRLWKLKVLSLAENPISEQRFLDRLKELRELNFCYLSPHNAGINPQAKWLGFLSNFSKLKKLSLKNSVGPAVSDIWRALISECPHLEELDLSYCSGLKFPPPNSMSSSSNPKEPLINRNSNLRKLNIVGSVKDLHSLQPLTQLVPNLETLQIACFSNKHAADIAQFPHLRSLSVAHTQGVTDAFLDPISALNELEELSFELLPSQESSLTEAIAPKLSGYVQLKKLCLDEPRMLTKKILSHLSKMPQLEQVIIRKDASMSWEEANKIIQSQHCLSNCKTFLVKDHEKGTFLRITPSLKRTPEPTVKDEKNSKKQKLI